MYSTSTYFSDISRTQVYTVVNFVLVAERISFEKGENVGDSVGYKVRNRIFMPIRIMIIRLESKGGRHSSIIFCTNGILLRVLVSKGTDRLKPEALRKAAKRDISDITHIIVDHFCIQHIIE
ncbi:DExH-box ATP-dependent RNA helicase DExH6 [Vitis vinifera]|uniref:DExH-box ATP-dependent RNA helicase DExH6 n=1 Tax=Vitis vinifera TaxID=29760 RepID=A0A438HCZ0_VITVI|nr:DExH-box ATP-dependent RNA helicase DExH6 [Vitis vinifera]